MSLRSKLFSFEGRLRRRDWWILGFGLVLIQLLLSFVAVRGVGMDLIEATTAAPFTPGWLVVTSASLVFLWPNLALSAKRAQDRNIPGVWAVALMVIVYAPGLAMPAQDTVVGLATAALVCVVSLVVVVILGFLDGTPGPNRFGPSPKGARDLADVFG